MMITNGTTNTGTYLGNYISIICRAKIVHRYLSTTDIKLISPAFYQYKEE